MIAPCHYCFKPVTSEAHYCHDVVCTSESCQQLHAEQQRKTDEALARVRDLHPEWNAGS